MISSIPETSDVVISSTPETSDVVISSTPETSDVVISSTPETSDVVISPACVISSPGVASRGRLPCLAVECSAHWESVAVHHWS